MAAKQLHPVSCSIGTTDLTSPASCADVEALCSHRVEPVVPIMSADGPFAKGTRGRSFLAIPWRIEVALSAATALQAVISMDASKMQQTELHIGAHQVGKISS